MRFTTDEQTYLFIQDYTRIRMAISVLSSVLPDKHPELPKILRLLDEWKDRLYRNLELKEENKNKN